MRSTTALSMETTLEVWSSDAELPRGEFDDRDHRDVVDLRRIKGGSGVKSRDRRQDDRKRSFKWILWRASPSGKSSCREGCSPLALPPPPHCVLWRTPSEAGGPTSKSSAPFPRLPPRVACRVRASERASDDRAGYTCVHCRSQASDTRLRGEFIRYPSFA